MSKPRKILFLISGLGMGNSTRCSAVIDHLTEMGFAVDVMTSGTGRFYFASDHRLNRVLSCHPLQYGSKAGKLSILRTAIAAPTLGMHLAKNSVDLAKALREGQYSAVVMDSDYSLPKRFLRSRPRVYAINNASIVVEAGRQPGSLPRSVRPQFWVERLDAIYHKIVPDLVLAPTFSWNRPDAGKVRFIPPVVRRGISAARSADATPKKVLVMLSGSQLGKDVAFLKKLPPLPLSIEVIGPDRAEVPGPSHARFLGKVRDNRVHLENADILVINAGFSAASEAFALRKPTVVIPLERHAEQWVNALALQELGFASLASSADAHVRLLEMVERYKEYAKRCESLPACPDGALRAARIIREDLDRFSRCE